MRLRGAVLVVFPTRLTLLSGSGISSCFFFLPLPKLHTTRLGFARAQLKIASGRPRRDEELGVTSTYIHLHPSLKRVVSASENFRL
ncbi:hypothetical protein F4802DRAFT_575586 [Xylaria palmicola]|nr:hypothetical protein F4802DRAFT_575586 [Xylaria palmicola]